MRPWMALTSASWLGVIAITVLPSLGAASPLFPAVQASRSVNGKYLVIVERTFDNPDPSAVRRVLGSTYVVLQSESFLNYRDRLQTPAPFWSAFGWQVSPDGEASNGTFLPLISDEGQILVLVKASVAWKLGNREVMRIYRKQGNTAKLVRALRLSDVWTPEEIESNAVLSDMGGTPMWYAGGSLEFTADDSQLLYRSRWNDKVSIDLADGSTLFERK